MRRLCAFAVVLCWLVLVPGVAAAGGPARLLKDINTDHPVDGRNDPSSPAYVATAVGPDGKARALFFAYAGQTELWATDGTPRGTSRIKALGTWLYGHHGTAIGGIAYFGADDGIHGQELWRSDGTSEGTWMVADPLEDYPRWHGLQEAPVACRGRVYYGGDDGYTGNELWSSDGSEAGTGMVRDIVLGDDSSNPELFTVAGDTLFFLAWDHGRGLWASDGTETGTRPIRAITQGGSGYCCNNMTPFNGRLLFYAWDGVHDVGPWVSDGTEQGTFQVAQVAPHSTAYYFGEVKVIGETAFFSIHDGVHGLELWKTDGTEGGTALTRDIEPGSAHSRPSFLGAIGNSLLFTVRNEPEPGYDIWKSDGTESGTVRVTGPVVGDAYAATDLAEGVLFSLTGSAEEGRELWRSDGTAEGTALVQDLAPGARSSDPRNFVALGTRILFVADDPAANRELFVGHTSLLVGRPDLAVRDLGVELLALGLPTGFETSLMARLDIAAKAIASGRNAAAVVALQSFIRHLEAQVPRRIDAADAADLKEFAADLADLLTQEGSVAAPRPAKPGGPTPVPGIE